MSAGMNSNFMAANQMVNDRLSSRYKAGERERMVRIGRAKRRGLGRKILLFLSRLTKRNDKVLSTQRVQPEQIALSR